MKTMRITKLALLVLTLSVLSGCSCSTHCSRGEPMARPAIALRDVHFGFDSAELTPTAKQTLREDFETLGLGSTSANARILLEGRADERGDSDYNVRLSERRATAVENYLLSLGAKRTQFETRELGEKAPIATGSDPDAYAKNRTVRVLAM